MGSMCPVFSPLVAQRPLGPAWCHMWFRGDESYISRRGGTRARREVPWPSMLREYLIFAVHISHLPHLVFDSDFEPLTMVPAKAL